MIHGNPAANLAGGTVFPARERCGGLPRALLGRSSVSAAMLTIGIASTLEECAQLFSHTRTFDPVDLGANLAGVICFTCWPHRLLIVPLGVAIYLNFFTHQFVADLRWFLMLAVAVVFFRRRMVATNTDKPRTMPLVGTFAGLGCGSTGSWSTSAKSTPGSCSASSASCSSLS